MKGFTIIEGFVFLAGIGIFVAILASTISESPEAASYINKDREEEYCSRIGLQRTFEQLPVACIKYYR